jgi:hypothetical protein
MASRHETILACPVLPCVFAAKTQPLALPAANVRVSPESGLFKAGVTFEG